MKNWKFKEDNWKRFVKNWKKLATESNLNSIFVVFSERLA